MFIGYWCYHGTIYPADIVRCDPDLAASTMWALSLSDSLWMVPGTVENV